MVTVRICSLNPFWITHPSSTINIDLFTWECNFFSYLSITSFCISHSDTQKGCYLSQSISLTIPYTFTSRNIEMMSPVTMHGLVYLTPCTSTCCYTAFQSHNCSSNSKFDCSHTNCLCCIQRLGSQTLLTEPETLPSRPYCYYLSFRISNPAFFDFDFALREYIQDPKYIITEWNNAIHKHNC